ncbi:HEAT repeat domain-containing protein [Listeria booriae]|uniref:HEAT repeat domain-containing protein n=1 Tax=Listeria booriae TaxID=1552123 RepID=UPI001624BD9B|nr:HEAT repeat domain-containing protein [Listeria booriae]MBC1272975.1 HEAT repeat domain-containing protein [Listeria booriae]
MKKRLRKKLLDKLYNANQAEFEWMYKHAQRKRNHSLKYGVLEIMASDREVGAIDGDVKKILLKSLIQEDRYTASMILDELMDIYDEELISYAIDNLTDEYFFKRLVCAEYLGVHRETKAVPMLITLLDDADDQVRVQAIEALGRMGDKSVVQVLLDRLKDTDTDNEFLKCAYYAALYNLEGDKTWINKLIGLLQSADSIVQTRAANRLVQITEGEVFFHEILDALERQILIETNKSQKEELQRVRLFLLEMKQ